MGETKKTGKRITSFPFLMRYLLGPPGLHLQIQPAERNTVFLFITLMYIILKIGLRLLYYIID